TANSISVTNGITASSVTLTGGVVAASMNVSGTITANTVSATTISGNGAGLTNLSAASITSGNLGVANGGTGATSLTANGILMGNDTGSVSAITPLTDGQVLIGRTGSTPIPATLTAGMGVTITTGNGTITIAGSGGSSGSTFTGSLTFSGVTTDITTATNEHLALMPNGTGKVGIGTTAPASPLTVSGGITVGSGYTGIAAPTNGAAIQGALLVGTTSQIDILTVSGNATIAGWASEGGGLRLRNFNKTGASPQSIDWVAYNMTAGYTDSYQLWNYTSTPNGSNLDWGPRFIIKDTGVTHLAPIGSSDGTGARVGIGISASGTVTGSLQIGNESDSDAVKFGKMGLRHHLSSNRDMVFNAYDPDASTGNLLFAFRKNSVKFDENSYSNVAMIWDTGLEVSGSVKVRGMVYGPFNSGSGSGSVSIDWSALTATNRVEYTAGLVATTISFSGAPAGPANLMVVIKHNGTQPVSFSGLNIKWPGGVAPTFTTTNGAVDIVTFYYDGTNYYGMPSFDYK
ncbi:hypothetical protein EBR96_02455, partial [bacterium]|nr:hypothetical protein [bacterium]